MTVLVFAHLWLLHWFSMMFPPHWSIHLSKTGKLTFNLRKVMLPLHRVNWSLQFLQIKDPCLQLSKPVLVVHSQYRVSQVLYRRDWLWSVNIYSISKHIEYPTIHACSKDLFRSIWQFFLLEAWNNKVSMLLMMMIWIIYCHSWSISFF
jgi:hypothetical protein